MQIRLQIIIPLAFVIFISCQISINKQEKIEKYYDDGKIESRFFMEKGKKNGKATLFYQNGNLKQEGNWINDMQEGLWLFYFDNGLIYAKINFRNGAQSGKSIYYYLNGNIEQEGDFFEGRPSGVSKRYYPNGKTKQIANWKEGKWNGEVIDFDSLSNNSKRSMYSNGLLISE